MLIFQLFKKFPLKRNVCRLGFTWLPIDLTNQIEDQTKNTSYIRFFLFNQINKATF